MQDPKTYFNRALKVISKFFIGGGTVRVTSVQFKSFIAFENDNFLILVFYCPIKNKGRFFLEVIFFD
jgi:hypothetical protein